MMKAFRQSNAFAMMFARMAPVTPTEATSIVPYPRMPRVQDLRDERDTRAKLSGEADSGDEAQTRIGRQGCCHTVRNVGD